MTSQQKELIDMIVKMIERGNDMPKQIRSYEESITGLQKKLEEMNQLSSENDTLKARIKQLEKIEETMKALKGLL